MHTNSILYVQHARLSVESSHGRGCTFGARRSGRLNSSREERPAFLAVFLAYLFKDERIEVVVRLRERMPSKSCFGWDVELLMLGARKRHLQGLLYRSTPPVTLAQPSFPGRARLPSTLKP